MTSQTQNQASDVQVVNVLKGLVIDGVNAAKCGHPGGAMSSMDFAYVLFSEFLQFDPDDAEWIGRDRFILSAGHESMLQYALLNLIGWLPTDELRRFRQLGSKTPGHPENTHTKGVECTTGPLGQGVAMSVGFAIAASHLGAKLDASLFSHRIYALMGDGCFQEDVTLGAASLAGHLGLSNLTWYYDRNRQQISGNISRATSDDEQKIFEGFGWQVIKVDGHNHQAIRNALRTAQVSTKPTLIIGDTTMAKGTATMEGNHETHGAPLPAEERNLTKIKLGLSPEQDFQVPPEALDHFKRNFLNKKSQVQLWKSKLKDLMSTRNNFTVEWNQYFGAENWQSLQPVNWSKGSQVATRNAFGDVLKQWANDIPKLIGGSADLEPSNMTGPFAKAVGDFQKETKQGRNLAFGVREFPMSAIANGIALHGGLIPFDATFLSFADYSRPALRLGAIQQCRVIHEFTHDSFYLGEDGPTHQPVEHVMSLRLIPDFYVMRPADARETQLMMQEALKLTYPSAICLSRQKLPVLELSKVEEADARKGAWVVHHSENPDVVIYATGSEVSLAIEASKLLANLRIKIVSLPCWELALKQPKDWQDKIFSPSTKIRVSIEAGSTLGWQKFTGEKGLNIGLDHYGASAPMEVLAEEYGFTPEKVAAKIKSLF
ncbi:MAG: transketolase [Proteobacteria bacterium]|nr:transketolase [Pseudomonadota bacterium]